MYSDFQQNQREHVPVVNKRLLQLIACINNSTNSTAVKNDNNDDNSDNMNNNEYCYLVQ